MTTWRGVRKEVVGAWRSVQYDLSRVRRSRRTDGEETTELIFPERSRPPRRLAATGAFVLVSLAGAVGTYVAVVSGLGALLEPADQNRQEEKPAAILAEADGTGRRPAQARPDDPTTIRIARQGGPLTVAGREAAAGRAASDGQRRGDDGPAAKPALPRGVPMPEESEDPDTPAPTASATESPTPSPAPSETASPTPTPDDEHSAEPSTDPTGERRHRHHRRDQDENP
ncbi:hypothetical protein O7635_35185 [Asanoa sp. WMMD1127]|uniref:hypothetical protein n=1 Tax=Asanoa sp. WMMD1127 TaxID=3016107 RepID=UPI0024179364|nr:hypothetical protein [Asanoa sp. WMMD1127]MDG4827119.1 hypothetical protein [Asanoa sp. WMMD1127]